MTDANLIPNLPHSDSVPAAAEAPAAATTEAPAVAASDVSAAAISEAPTVTASEMPAAAISDTPAVTISEPPAAILSAAPADAVSPEATQAIASAPASATVIWMDKFRSTVAKAIPENRAAMVAAGIGFVVGGGLLIGTLGVMGVGHLFAAPPASSAPWSGMADESRAMKQSMAKLEAQVSGLKASIEASNRHANAQRSQITDRYEKATRTQAEMQTRLVKIGDALERLEKRVTAVVAAEATGSVAPRYAATAAGAQSQPQPPAADAKAAPRYAATTAAPPPAPEVRGAPPALLQPPVIEGWVIRDVFRGRAVVTNRRGVFEAAPGLRLPELGRVEAVTQQNGHWVVVTERGIITAMRQRPRGLYGSEPD